MDEHRDNEIEALARLAPTLKEAELRTLLELMRRRKPGEKLSASSRDLAEATRLSRSWLIAALDSLADRGIITTTAGTATRPASYRLDFLETVCLGGPAAGPPPRPAKIGGGLVTGPPPVSQRDQGGLATRPPLFENTPLADEEDARRVFRLENPILDRVLRCKSKHCDQETLARFRAWLGSHMAKFGVDSAGKPVQNPHPPDDQIVAQFMACGEERELQRLLQDLMLEKQPVYNYAWFVVVALQRLHGVTFNETAKARQQLRIVKHKPAAAPVQQTLLETGAEAAQEERAEAAPSNEDLRAAIGAAARKKAM